MFKESSDYWFGRCMEAEENNRMLRLCLILAAALALLGVCLVVA